MAGPQGELLTVFPNDEEEVRVIEIDKTRSENAASLVAFLPGSPYRCVWWFDRTIFSIMTEYTQEEAVFRMNEMGKAGRPFLFYH